MSGWVAIDKCLVKTLTDIDRPFSYVEAVFSHSVNLNCGKDFSINGYASRWQWSKNKVRKFLLEINTTEGYEAGKNGRGNGTKIHLSALFFEGQTRDNEGTNEDQENVDAPSVSGDSRDIEGTLKGQTRDTIIKNKEQRTKKQQKNTRFCAYDFLLSLNAEKQLVEDWLKVRKIKKLADTKTAFYSFLKEVEKSGVGINEVLKICCERSWGGFKVPWLEKEKQTQEAVWR